MSVTGSKRRQANDDAVSWLCTSDTRLIGVTIENLNYEDEILGFVGAPAVGARIWCNSE